MVIHEFFIKIYISRNLTRSLLVSMLILVMTNIQINFIDVSLLDLLFSWYFNQKITFGPCMLVTSMMIFSLQENN